jgi:hypothetical protein
MSIRRLRTWKKVPAAALLGAPLVAWADSGVGVDTWRADKLDPTGGEATQVIDANGTSWLESTPHRTPTGSLYPTPVQTPEADKLSVWDVYGTFDLGYLHTSGEKTALFDRYTAWPTNGPALEFDVNAERAADGSYAEVRGSRLSAEDQYYQAVYGQAGAYKAEVFVRDMPNLLSTDAKSIWNGAGTGNLTLRDGLTPGGSTSAQVAAVSAAAPVTSLGYERNKQGISLSAFLTPHWSVYLNASDEERRGDRPYGGPFFFADSGGAVLETIKPIDDATVNISAGARYAGSEWRFDVGYSGSLYRDHYLSYSFQNPFALGPPVVPGAVAAPINQGQMSTEPNNEYHELHATATRLLPMNGEASLTASGGEMLQNDNLIPPTNCQGVFGMSSNGSFNLGPQNPNLFPCDQWNTTAALSQKTANMLIVTTLTQGTLVLQPVEGVSVRAGAKYYREDYRNQYVMYNPENGDYGYVPENGALTSIVPGAGIWNPVTYPMNSDVQVRSIPYGWDTTEAYAGIDWKPTRHDTLGLTYTFDHYDPSHREVSFVNDNSVKLSWTDRSVEWATFRFNYTYLNQSGSVYNSDPYAFAFFYNLPGFVPADDTPYAWTVNAMRKYDISDRDENKADVMATFIPRADMTLTASFRGDWNQYPAVIGRQGYATSAAALQWEWQIEARTGISLWAGVDRSSMHMANVNDQPTDTPDDTLGGSTYPLSNRWWASDKERNWSGGASVTHYFRNVRLDAGWDYLSSRGITSYSFASGGALTYPDLAASAGSQFPAMTYIVNSLKLSLTIPLTERASLRLYDYWEHGQVADWHYSGFNSSLVYGDRVYTDAGPQGYDTNVVGLFVNVKL